MAKKIWIDCGAHKGVITRHFMQRHDGYEGYAFEPNPNTITIVPSNVTLFKVAVWIENCALPFYLFEKDATSEGCTLLKEKINRELDKKNPITVECVDFGAWLREICCTDDKVIVKMDIEGAEYVVLKKMIGDGTISLISKLYIEFHWKKLKMKKAHHNKFVKRLRQYVEVAPEYYKVHRASL